MYARLYQKSIILKVNNVTADFRELRIQQDKTYAKQVTNIQGEK